ncbi:MAG: response regulator [Deltaproteobacteria bacterium]|nr:response regulator [Candidatus Anaeroferrophillus wilburensis]MBN2889003.1 response regulator [Deltaproteobacteria bacterium]
MSGTAFPDPEDGVDRQSGRRHRPRFQQHPHRHQWLRPDGPASWLHVIEAEHGLDSLEQARSYQETIDLLSTDAVMPIMGGKELSEQIKGIYPAIPILFSSGYMDNGIHQDIINLGGDRFINKPCSIQDVTARIRRLLDEKKS